MQQLMENPLPILAIGGLTLAILIGGLFKTGNATLLWAIAATVVLTGLLVFAERAIVTPAEEVENAIFALAEDIKANDPQAVIARLSDSATQLKQDAKATLKRVTVHNVKIKNLSLIHI